MILLLILTSLSTLFGVILHHTNKVVKAKMLLNHYLEEEAYSARKKRKQVTDGGIVVFHGACLDCKTQITLGIDQCKSCKYFNVTRNFHGESNDLPDLRT